MKYLLDTCVISEVIRKKPSQQVLSWLHAQDETTLYLSVLTFGEIQKGIEKTSDNTHKNKLMLWVEEDLKKRFENRVIPVTLKIATTWGTAQGIAEKAGQTMPSIDGLIAVSGLINNCIVVTRNIPDMEQSGVTLLNPWLYEG